MSAAYAVTVLTVLRLKASTRWQFAWNLKSSNDQLMTRPNRLFRDDDPRARFCPLPMLLPCHAVQWHFACGGDKGREIWSACLAVSSPRIWCPAAAYLMMTDA
jgi:hypothetical protein